MSEGALIPFGKYKGQPVEVLASDRDYCEWLTAQTWFVQRYPQVHTLVINNFGEPTETPEHNALQIRLLDETFRAQCTEVALQFFDKDRQWGHTVETWHGRTEMRLGTPYFSPAGQPDFEYAGIDVTWQVYTWGIRHLTGHETPSTLPDQHQSLWEKRTSTRAPGVYQEVCRIAVECKPLVDDDYPAILRFLKNLPSRELGGAHLMVLAGDVCSQTVPLEAIKQFFALSNILLVRVEEVEAVEDIQLVRTSQPTFDAHHVYLHIPGKRCSACLGVEGRQIPYTIPLTPQRFWEVFKQRFEDEHPGDYGLRNALFYGQHRYLTIDDHAVRIGITDGHNKEALIQPDNIARLQKTLQALMGREMTIILEEEAA